MKFTIRANVDLNSLLFQNAEEAARESPQRGRTLCGCPNGVRTAPLSLGDEWGIIRRRVGDEARSGSNGTGPRV